MVRVGKGCVDHNDNTTLCYVACHSDNCNHSCSLAVQVTHVLIGLILYIVIPL